MGRSCWAGWGFPARAVRPPLCQSHPSSPHPLHLLVTSLKTNPITISWYAAACSSNPGQFSPYVALVTTATVFAITIAGLHIRRRSTAGLIRWSLEIATVMRSSEIQPPDISGSVEFQRSSLSEPKQSGYNHTLSMGVGKESSHFVSRL